MSNLLNNSCLDALLICTTHLYDSRILNLKNENEELKLENFWLKYNINTFQSVMKTFNYFYTQCACISCKKNNRFSDSNLEDIRFNNKSSNNCKFKVPFEWTLTKFGLTYTNIECNSDQKHQYINNELCSNAEFHFENSKYMDWSSIKFGTKLTSAKLIYNKELKKYKHFIDYFN